MQYRQLGKTGLRVSVIGLGGFPLSRMPASAARILVAQARACGVNFLDTAGLYGGEMSGRTRIGPALEIRDSHLFSEKTGDRPSPVPGSPATGGLDRGEEVILAVRAAVLSARDAKGDVVRACQRLKLEALDLFQIDAVHRRKRLEAVLEPDGAVEGLRALREAGRVRHIGITGHNPDVLCEALERCEDLETVQFPFNILEDGEGVRRLLRLAAERNVGTIATKPLAGGILPEPLKALRWAVSQPVSTILVGMSSADDVTAAAAIGDRLEPLTAAEEADLRAQVETLGNQFCRRCMVCEPCPQGIPIYTTLELAQKASLPHMADLVREVYDDLEIKADACAKCGECEERCPQGLPLIEMLGRAHDLLTS